MKLALKLAEKGRTSPNPKVGCVITRFGFIVGKGYHQKAGMPHAEIEALKDAGSWARGGTMYVTLEPCSHHGKTPPCANAIIRAGIKKVVIAMKDPNPLVNGEGIRRLKQAGIKVVAGVMENEAKKLNEMWVKYIATKSPFVTLKAAVSMDGKIATKTNDSKWITGIESRHFAHILRNRHDAVVVGINTVLKDNPQLTARIKDGRNPLRIILDSKLKIPLESNVLNDGNVLIVTTKKHNAEAKILLDEKKYNILVMDSDKIILKDLMQELGKRNITSVLIEGGSEVFTSALEEGIVDKAIFFIAPKLIGGDDSVSVIGGKGIEKISQALRLENVKIARLGDDAVVEGDFDFNKN